MARAILQEPKLYFYDTGLIEENEGARLENTIAVCLLKYCEYMRDSKGQNISLHYMKTKEGKEVDFAIAVNMKLKQLIEIKLSDNNVAKSLLFFCERFPEAEAFQLVHNLRQPQHVKGINIVQAGEWLSQLEV